MDGGREMGAVNGKGHCCRKGYSEWEGWVGEVGGDGRGKDGLTGSVAGGGGDNSSTVLSLVCPTLLTSTTKTLSQL